MHTRQVLAELCKLNESIIPGNLYVSTVPGWGSLFRKPHGL